jgi:hypothetical protein
MIFFELIQVLSLSVSNHLLYCVESILLRSEGAVFLSPLFQRHCPKADCGRQLRKKQYTARLFTLRRGVLPVLAISSYCDGEIHLHISQPEMDPTSPQGVALVTITTTP